MAQIIPAGVGTLLIVAAAILAFFLSNRNFDSAQAANPWLKWVRNERAIVDRFRFAFYSESEIARAMAPAAVQVIATIPLTISNDLNVTRQLIADLNSINAPCALVSAIEDSCGEDAVRTRHATLERGLQASPLAQDWWIERKRLELSLLKLIVVSTDLCGLTPYQTQTAFRVVATDGHGSTGTTGWTALAPGECKSLEFGKFRHMPKIFAYSRANDPTQIDILRQDPNYTNVWGQSEIAWGGPGAVSCVSETTSAEAIEPPACSPFGQYFRFSQVRMSRGDGWASGSWQIVDPGLTGREVDGLPLASLTAHAQALARVLPKRRAYQYEYRDSAPYINGIDAVDDNGPYRAGIRVRSVMAETPFGSPIPFQAGDEITELDGTPIFSIMDLNLALANFATTRGANQSYRYQYWRFNAALGTKVKDEGSATVFFDADYWVNHGYSDSALSAFFYGLGNAVTFGLYRNAYCLWKSSVRGEMKYDACMIYAINKWMILRQLYPRAYRWGSVPAMLFSPIKSILSVTGVALSAGQDLAIEVLEAGLSVLAERAPGEAIEVSAQSLVQNVALARAANFATALTVR